LIEQEEIAMARNTKQAKEVATSNEKQGAARQEASDQHGQSDKIPAEQVVGERTRSRRTFRPPVDIYENEQGLMLLADVPGAKPEGLHITLERHVLNVWAEVEDHAPEGYSSIYQEYEVGDFERQFTLSGDFDAEKIEASLLNGVLKLTIPRAAEAAPRTIKVKAGE
jgi:HSP20 family molecular chaperone IbpA